MVYYVQVIENENTEPIEVPTEEDGAILLSALSALFPGACGLKYRTESGNLRGLRLIDGRIYSPESGWGSLTYLCVFAKDVHRRNEEDDVGDVNMLVSKTKQLDLRSKCSDLIVLGLPWSTSEKELREHFESFGEVLMAQVKKDSKSGHSKGFGFIRFNSLHSQSLVLSQRHLINGRVCDVKIPNSKDSHHKLVPCKVFVGRCTEDINCNDLREYFCNFGEVTDVFIPRPFRAFAFVTFVDANVAQALCGEDHIIKNTSVHISNASPKVESHRQQQPFYGRPPHQALHHTQHPHHGMGHSRQVQPVSHNYRGDTQPSPLHAPWIQPPPHHNHHGNHQNNSRRGLPIAHSHHEHNSAITINQNGHPVSTGSHPGFNPMLLAAAAAAGWSLMGATPSAHQVNDVSHTQSNGASGYVNNWGAETIAQQLINTGVGGACINEQPMASGVGVCANEHTSGLFTMPPLWTGKTSGQSNKQQTVTAVTTGPMTVYSSYDM